ncbi:MAG: hypothetical protein WBA76_16610 [Phormidesmis sp.]
MAPASRQQILIGFDTEQALQQAYQSLEGKALSTVEAEVLAPLDKDVPEERSLNPGIAKAAGLGATMGAIAGGLIITTALNLPDNIASISENATPLAVIVVLLGAAFGGLGGGVTSFFSGASPDAETPANYKLRVEASSEEVKTATQVLLDAGGRLL